MINVRNEVLIKAIGARIRTLRKQQGLSMEKFAELAEIDYRQLSYLELGQSNPTVSTLYQISKALKITISELLKLENF